MREFRLTELKHGGPLFGFRSWCEEAAKDGERWVRLRISAGDGTVATALWWRHVIRDMKVGVYAVLEGHVILPAVLVWAACPGRAVSDSCWISFARPVTEANDEAAAVALSGILCLTENGERRQSRITRARNLLRMPDRMTLGARGFHHYTWFTIVENAAACGQFTDARRKR